MIKYFSWLRCPTTFCIFSMFAVLATSTVANQPAPITNPPITDIAFAPDGQSLVCCSQRGLQVFSWPELKLQRSAKTAFPNVQCLEFSPAGNRLAVGGGEPSQRGAVEIFSWPDCQSQMELSGHDDSVVSVVWRGDNYLVAASLDRLLTEWNVETKTKIKTYQGHSRGVSSACLLPNGEMVTTGHDQSVRVWDGDSGELLRSLNQHSRPINAIAVCPKSAGQPIVATAAGDRTIRFWQPIIGRMVRYIRLESEPLDIAWIGETQIVASCADGQARVIDAEKVEVLETIPVIKGWAYTVASHPQDGTWVLAGSDGQIRRVKRTRTE